MLKERYSETVKVLSLASAAILLPLAARAGDFKEIDLSPLPALEAGQATKTPQTPAALEAPEPSLSDEPFFVLCYHRFLQHPAEREDLAQAEYQMPVDEFKWQMQYLKDNGFHPISEEQLMGYWFQGKPLPLKPVLITFDDGFRTIYRDAFPIIKSQGFPTVLFLYTKFIEYRELADKRREESVKLRPDQLEKDIIGPHGQPLFVKHLNPKKVKLKFEALEDSDILEMEKSGMVVESHTANHLNLGKEGEKLDEAKAQKLWAYELTQPLTFIESRFKNKPDWLAYPYGVYDPGILKVVEAAGYKLAFTVNPGPNDRTLPPLMLKRNLVLYPISHKRFADIFQDRVLHLKNLSPGDGDLIDSQRPVITAQIEDDVKPKSVKLQIGNHVIRAEYDPRTHIFQHPLGADLARGGHILTVQAKDVKGFNRVYNWYFRIKHKKHEKNTAEEAGNDAIQN